MTTGPDVDALRIAYREAAVSDLDRTHAEIVADAAARVGVDESVAAGALPRLASVEWQREFSPSRDASPIPDELSVAQALETLRTHEEAAVRAQTVSDALAYATGGTTADVVVAALGDPDATVRATAIRRSWLATGDTRVLREKISELLAGDPDVSVRAAALRSTVLSGDASPTTVTALLATISPANDSSLRIEAARALAASGEGYARVCRSLLRWAEREDDVPVRTALYDAGARLATEAEWPHLVSALMRKASSDVRVGLLVMSALRAAPSARVAVRDAARAFLDAPDAATRAGAVSLLAGSTFVGDDIDLAADRAVDALADDPDENVRTAVFVTSASRRRAEGDA